MTMPRAMSDGRYSMGMDSEPIAVRLLFLSFALNDSSDLRGAWFEKWPGAIRPLLRWETELLSPELQVTR